MRGESKRPASVTIGFAAGRHGQGVAYVQLGARAETLIRVPFAVRRFPALGGREVAYAALSAVLKVLLERGTSRLEIAVDDALLVDELQRRREVPRALALAYIQLGCLLNRLHAYAFASCDGAELTRRARSEVETPAAA
jgi:hypothetical protein